MDNNANETLNPINNNTVDYHFKSTQSFSHMVGCITALMIDYIKLAFDERFFSTVRVTTEVPYHERREWLRDVAKKPRPMMILEPKFDISDDTKFLPSREYDYLIPNDTSDKICNIREVGNPLILDDKARYQLFNTTARYKITFNISFIFDSEIQQMQAQEHIRQNIRHQIYSVLSRYVEYNIPQNFMEAIALIENMDLNSDEFLSRMNQLSLDPITYRVRSGSGNKEFFVLKPCSLNVLFTSLPNNNGSEKKGKVITSASFTESVEVEFPANSTYFLRTNVDVGDKIDMSNIAILSTATLSPVSTQVTMAVANIPLFGEYENNYKKVLQLSVQCDSAETDTLSIDNYVSGEVRKIIEYHKTNSIPITFLQCKVAENSTRLDSNRYSFDPTTLSVSIINSDAYKNYVIALYSDYEYINSLKKSIIAFEDYDDIKSQK